MARGYESTARGYAGPLKDPCTRIGGQLPPQNYHQPLPGRSLARQSLLTRNSRLRLVYQCLRSSSSNSRHHQAGRHQTTWYGTRQRIVDVSGCLPRFTNSRRWILKRGPANVPTSAALKGILFQLRNLIYRAVPG